jgi:DNA mismatch repair protein MutH
MERRDAIPLLEQLVGKEIHALAQEYDVFYRYPDGRLSKGYAGHVCERHLGLPLNSSQSPNFGSWELKTVPIKRLASGEWVYKETMAVTMIDPVNVAKTPFEESHLLSKLKKFVLVVRTVGKSAEDPSYFVKVSPINLTGELFDAVKADYEEVRECIRDPKRGFSSLTGSMGRYIQPRTKGAGHGSTSRAFYAKKEFLNAVAEINVRGDNPWE